MSGALSDTTLWIDGCPAMEADGGSEPDESVEIVDIALWHNYNDTRTFAILSRNVDLNRIRLMPNSREYDQQIVLSG